MKKILLLIGGLIYFSFTSAQIRSVSLSGEWSFKIDSANTGERNKWYIKPNFKNTLKLPGTLDDRGIGDIPDVDTNTVNEKVMQRLSRRHRYVGAAWYSREFDVESSAEYNLMLERVLWRTDCWIDGIYKGVQEGISAPQKFFLGKLSRGRHTIVLRINNSRQYDISLDNLAAAYTDDTQIIWNGVIGKITLTEQNKIQLERAQFYPDVVSKTVKLQTEIVNAENKVIPIKQVVEIYDGGHLISKAQRKLWLSAGSNQINGTIDISRCQKWEEFNPVLYTISIRIEGEKGELLDHRRFTTGFRHLSNKDSRLQINGHPLFLRGTLDCNVYPLEGHPPMNAEAWAAVLKTAKSYGLNHIRFHSWCPPEAAFKIADSLGFYFHIELPLWSLTVGKDKPTLAFLESEAKQIINSYGNHPSFCFWSMGNELEGNYGWLDSLVAKLKHSDNRRLYTSSTFSFQNGHGKWPGPQDDYFITQYTKKGWVRGQGIFNTSAPDFRTDYTMSVDSLPVPLVIHEMGQYSVYPDMEEIKKYTGVLDPLNFKAVRNDLSRKNMLGLAKSFMLSSGHLAVSLYKEEIERALKTRYVSGFQLLDLHDFPGQGTALVGLLNAFWESKGLITPKDFHEFCGPVVPLLRFEKATYSNSEVFVASAQLANFSNKSLTVSPVWTITDNKKKVIFSGTLGKSTVNIGNDNDLGTFKVNLNGIKSARQLNVSLLMPEIGVRNEWKIWVYPEKTAVVLPGVEFTTSVDEAIKLLGEGKRVVLNPDTNHINGVPGRFAPVFWSPVHFPDQPGTMGLLCDTAHPALNDFPTAYYSDWQWWDLVTHSKTMITDALPFVSRPIVRVIDNFFKNRNMADVLEFNLGQGKLIICSMDIHHDIARRPVARQLKYSLMNYAGSNLFTPHDNITVNDLKKLFK